MQFIDSKKLEMFVSENKRKFEGLFPELIKKLVMASAGKISSIRIPSFDEINAPGYDGVVECNNDTKYVCAGKSVWEFGTNSSSLAKINSDYEKRTNNSLGVDKSTTTFYLVIPKIWAFDNQGMPKTLWEAKHNEWKSVKVYDAPVLCDWINSEPEVCAWLFEQVSEEVLSFCTVDKAWDNLSHYTNPCFKYSMFLTNREKQCEDFLNHLDERMTSIKADTHIGARGFVFAALKNNSEYVNECVVINDERTFKVLDQLCNNKIFILDFFVSGFIKSENNRIITCFNREAVSVDADIELNPMSKISFEKALKDMDIKEYPIDELYAFCHGNLRALIRKIPGDYFEPVPEWSHEDNIEYLVPLVFLHSINRKTDKAVVEKISGCSFTDIERTYNRFEKLEDTPVKKVNENYLITNYEEAWTVLEIGTNYHYFEVLGDVLDDIFSHMVSGDFNSKFELYGKNIERIIRNLIFNYVYFHYDNFDSDSLEKSICKVLSYMNYIQTRKIIIDNLDVLAAASPHSVLHFLKSDYEKEKDSVIKNAFDEKFGSAYCRILAALDELMLYSETIVGASNLLYKINGIRRDYAFANTPEESLLSGLCLWYCEGTSSLAQKEKIIIRIIENEGVEGAFLMVKLIGKDSLTRAVRIGTRHVGSENVSINDLIKVINNIIDYIFRCAVNNHNALLVLEVLKLYEKIYIDRVDYLCSCFIITDYPEEDVRKINYWLRNDVFNIKRFKWENRINYIPVLEKWIEHTSSPASETIDYYYWMFCESYECPSDLLLPYEDDYKAKDEKTYELRVKVFNDLYCKYGEKAIERLYKSMSDETTWGYFIYDQVKDNDFQKVMSFLIDNPKDNITCGFMNKCSSEELIDQLSKMPVEVRKKYLPNIFNFDCVEVLTPDEIIEFCKGKNMFQYNEKVYHILLKNYPVGLISYLYIGAKEKPVDSILLIEEVFNSIIEQKCKIESDNDLYEIGCIISAVDKIYYSDEWISLCENMFAEGYLDIVPECLCKYYFDYPDNIFKYINIKHIDERTFFDNFRLPDYAYEDYAEYKRFFDVVRSSSENGIYYVGEIIGHSKKGADDFFPHEFARALLEEYDNDRLDRAVFTSFYNSLGVRWVSDGSDQKNKAEKYKIKIQELEVEYPHTTKILKSFMNECLSNAKSDYEYSELALF